MLRIFLLANCASCAAFGCLFLFFPIATAHFIGTPPALIIAALGGMLILNAVLLALTAWRWHNRPAVIGFFVAGDAAWVAATLLCLAFGVWIKGPTAIGASVLTAALVGGLGYGQYRFGLRPSRPNAAP